MKTCLNCGIELALVVKGTEGYCKKCDPSQPIPDEIVREPLDKPKYSRTLKARIAFGYYFSLLLPLISGCPAVLTSNDSVFSFAIIVAGIFSALSAVLWVASEVMSGKDKFDHRDAGGMSGGGGGP
jgi:hypothetical protein